uniref:Uncharacterized protein n=1 Tax=Plectus sambesii TaxID=2011161 RepID=A0A914WRW3_9BILA
MASFPMMSNAAHAKNIRVSMEQRNKLVDGGTVISSGRGATNKTKDDQRHSGWGTKNYHCGMTNGTNMIGTMKNLVNTTRIQY